MFDVSFSELLLILFVGLLVFGPEKLPQVVRTVGQWLARARRTFNQIRTEIEREAGVDELKRDLHNQSIMDSLKDVHNDLRHTQQELEHLPYDIDDIVNRTTAPAKPAPVEPPAALADNSAPAADTNTRDRQS
jgi:sec-independent protein translocase protein TatB